MRVLVACEFSGIVRDAFLAAGHEAVSCDLLPTESPGPHYEGDVLDILDDGWDMMIAHPPCTYLSRAGARWMYPTKGNLDMDRYRKAMQARGFFMDLLESGIPRIAIENPLPLRVADLPQHSQVIQPYEYGHPFSKRTHLWLRRLPPLIPTDVLGEYRSLLPSNTGGRKRGQRVQIDGVRCPREASKTFPGIAKAMASQWGAP